MQKTKTLLYLVVLLFGPGITIFGQCPPSVYNNYRFNESSGLSASGTSGSSSIVLTNPGWVSGVLGGSVSFNGTNSKGILTDNYFNWVSNEDYTIEFWVNLKSVNSGFNSVFIGRDDPVTALHWWIGAESVTGKPIFDLRDNANIFSEIIGNDPLIPNTWYHLAVVRDNVLHQNKLYVNGQLAGTSQVTYTGDFSSTVPVNLGMLNYNGSDAYYANCNIDELVFHNAALDASVILQHYQDQLNGTPICVSVPVPVNPNPVIKILTLGNSITYDDHKNDVRPVGQRGGYRVHLYNKLTAAGYNFDFIGSETSGQDLFPDAENGGFPGINKEQMVTLLQTGLNPRTHIQVTNGPYFNFYQPDVILLHLGSNDLTTDITAINQILAIIDAYRSQSGKDVKLFIAKIINRRTYDPLTTQYNQNLEQAVIAHNNPKNYIVDMENGAGIDYSTEMVDSLHPSDAGYEKMASLWYSSMTSILDAPSHCATSLKGYWNLDENSAGVLHDQISGNDATGNVDAIPVTGRINNAFAFNGTTSKADVTNGAVFNWSAASDFSLQFWIKKNSSCNANTNNVIIGRNDISTQLHWWIGVECSNGNQGKVTFNLIANNGDNQVLTGTTNIIDNNWHLVTVSRNGLTGNTSIFIDNSLDATGDHVFTGNFTSTVPVNIGWLNLSPYYYFEGTLDELALYDKPLVLTEVQSAYSAGLNSLTYCQQDFIKTPSNLTTTPLQGAITLSWKDNSYNESGFRIERKTGSGQFAQVIQLAANAVSYTDAGLQSSTSYTYRVYAFNGTGSSVYTNQSAAKTLVASNLINLAPGKTATQSSIAYGGIPARGNDDNTDGFWSNNSVIHTTNEQSPYWQIDLQAIYSLDHIEVWNRTDACCNSRMVNYYIFVSDVPFTSGDLTTTKNQSGVWNSLNAGYPNPSSTIAVNRTGRYVRIQLSALSELNLAEMRIFGNSGAPPPPVVPAAPTALNTLAISSVSAQLNWTDNASNENGFRVERKTGSGQFAQVIELGANAVSYTDAGLQPSTGYTYRVYAFNNTGNSLYSNESTVQTPAVSSVTNLAPGKPVIQSSTAYGGVAGHANDNNTDGTWNGGSVSHTGNELSPYWQIDLQAVYTIDHLEIWNRTDACCVSRMANYYAFVSDVPFASGDLTTTKNQSGVWNSLNANYPNPSSTIAVNRTGRYVRVQLANLGELSMAEVKVFGNSGPPPPPVVPTAPTALNTLAISSVSAQLNWTDNASNENGFRVERKTGSGQFAQVIELGANAINYTDAGLQPSTGYTYRVYAFNNTGNSLFSNESTVQTPAVSSATNLAPGKPVIQSSTAYGGVAGHANDNNTDGTWNGGSISHTGNELSPYWQIDLQANYNLDHLEVWNRTDACCASRTANYYTFVSDVPFASGNLNTTLNQSGVWNSFNANYPNPSSTIAVNRTGQYVRIQLANQGELNLAEIKIFGSSLKNAGGNQTALFESDNMILLVYPNPSINEVNIEFFLQNDSQGSISIFNMMGEEMTRLNNDVFYSGKNLFTWNGLDSQGKKTSPGLYIIRLIINEKSYLRKVIITNPN